MSGGIDKVLTITIDNASTNDVDIDYMRDSIIDNNCTVLDGEFLHMWFAIHILNLIVTYDLKDVYDFVTRIRDAIRYVKSSLAIFAKFKACAASKKIVDDLLECFY